MAKSEARTVGVRTRGRAFAALVAAAALVLTACTAGGQQLPAPAPAPSGSTAAPTEAPAGEARTLVIGATAEPRSRNCLASHSVSGVLPAPPTVMLPTTITGTGKCSAFALCRPRPAAMA